MTRDEQILSVDGLCKFFADIYKKLADPEDLYQEARLSVCKNIARYDASRGAKLSTFLFLPVRGDVLKFIERKNSDTRLPPDKIKYKRISWIRDCDEGFEIGRPDTYNEIDLSCLKPREQYVIKRYFYDRYTFDDIAEEAGFGCSYWYKVKKEALAKLKLKLSN